MKEKKVNEEERIKKEKRKIDLLVKQIYGTLLYALLQEKSNF